MTRRIVISLFAGLLTAAVIACVKLLINAVFEIDETRGDFIWSVVGVVAIALVANCASERAKRKKDRERLPVPGLREE